MANRASRPGRALIIFGVAVVLMYVGVVVGGVYKPKLGLDLQGGTQITLQASTSTGEAVTPAKLNEAAGIIDQRVNASGVSESQVTTQGNNNIVVEIPGKNSKTLVDTVKQTAQLRFRLVAAAAAGTPQPSPSPSPSTGPKVGKKGGGKVGPSASVSPSASPKGRAVSGGLRAADRSGAKAKPKPKASSSPSASGTPVPTPTPATKVPTNKSSVKDLLAWSQNPDPASQAAFAAYNCNKPQPPDNPAKPLLSCDKQGNKYLLSPAIIEGTQLTNADYGIPQNQVSYVVDLSFNGNATSTFSDVTRALAGTQQQFAIVLDGKVLSAPTVTTPINDGSAQISGNFTANSAAALANSLKYGALPLKFQAPVITEVGPTLASNQLSAGLLAGAIGLALVLIYCLLYYRGLGLVVLASLLIAGLITYAAVIFLSENAGFTLTLPGIAGLIVAVGITADSFIVYFERIRDEMREGRSLRVAIEAGWTRARMTCLAADSVSLLAAVVLYIFAIGVVKGFAFALGISTVIDLVVFFLFTKPMVTWLGHFRFFRTGHKLSGLSADHIGIERIGSATPAGGIAR